MHRRTFRSRPTPLLAKPTVTVLKQSSVYPTIGGDEIPGFFSTLVARSQLSSRARTTGACSLSRIFPVARTGDLPACQGWVYSGIDNGDNFLKKN
jgi:hypothetical protein